ncbi:hypothetical protein [Alicyclobacillus shizuokensis]|uniref:hypothetical protein n=1 Tax=Alicyclobacillus shizuokensis TaxID=392014 RepID=UPI00082B251D|nr:hypothetical protein [Alicyclobacillus shizuokensis]
MPTARTLDPELAAWCLHSFAFPKARLVANTVETSGPCSVAAADGRYQLWTAAKEVAGLRMAVADYAARHGFRRVPRPLSNLYHERLIPVDERTVAYITLDWDAPALEVTPTDVRDAAQNLAHLHAALSGLGETLGQPAVLRQRYGTWASRFRRGVDALARVRVQLLASDTVTRKRLRSDWLTRWTDLAEQALERLPRMGYDDVAERARRERSVAWNGYRLATLGRLADGRIFTRVVADPVGDDALYDLACLCRDIAESGHADGVEDALAGYHAIRPLSPEQAGLVRAFAVYPHRGIATALGWLSQPGHADDEDLSWRRTAEAHHNCALRLLAND